MSGRGPGSNGVLRRFRCQRHRIPRVLPGTLGCAAILLSVWGPMPQSYSATGAALALQNPIARHDKAFWRAVIANDYAPPPGAALAALLEELNGYLGSSDPELRDEIAYSVAANWIFRKRIVEPATLRKLAALWMSNLRKGIAEQNTDSVLLRSFSALSLATLVALDNEAPFLTGDEYRELLQETLKYFRDERDLRGFDSRKGWIHSVAHTADLLKFLARNRYLTRPWQAEVLAAIGGKLSASADVFTHGEDERLGRAVLSIVARDDLDAVGFREWLHRMTSLPRLGPLPTPGDLAKQQNVKSFVTSLYAIVSLDSRETISIRTGREIVGEGLRRLM